VSGRSRSCRREISAASAAPLTSTGAGGVNTIAGDGPPGVIAAENHAATAAQTTKMIVVRFTFIVCSAGP
jgi:hypothetical protein